MFLGVFPLINALFDFISYSITLTLVRWGLRLGGSWAVVVGVADLIMALFLFTALGSILILAIAGMHYP